MDAESGLWDYSGAGPLFPITRDVGNVGDCVTAYCNIMRIGRGILSSAAVSFCVRGVAQPGRAPGSGPGGRRFKSSLPDQSSSVRPGDIGNRTFRRHGLHFWPERIFKGLQSFLLQVYITEIIIHKADE